MIDSLYNAPGSFPNCPFTTIKQYDCRGNKTYAHYAGDKGLAGVIIKRVIVPP